MLLRASGPGHIFPRVIHETDSVLVVDKPPGVPFHGNDNQLGLVQLVRAGQADGRIAYTGRLHPVHRLDTVTSGIVLLAKGAANAGALTEAFRKRRVTKYYVALSGRPPSRKQGSVTGDMQRGRRAGWMLLRTHERPAVTRFVSFGLPEVRAGVRMFLLKPETGRTHQLRVALKSLGSPVLGDPQYAAAADAACEERAYLHAAALRVHLEGQPPLQVVCAPSVEQLFLHPAFRERFQALLPQELELDLGPWLTAWPLLRSEMMSSASGGGAAVDEDDDVDGTECEGLVGADW